MTKCASKTGIHFGKGGKPFREKEKSAGYQYFLHFPKCFQKAVSNGSLKFMIVSYNVKIVKFKYSKSIFCNKLNASQVKNI